MVGSVFIGGETVFGESRDLVEHLRIVLLREADGIASKQQPQGEIAALCAPLVIFVLEKERRCLYNICKYAGVMEW